MMLDRLTGYLKESELDHSLLAESAEIPFPRLLVFLGVSAQAQEYVLEITCQEQQINQDLFTTSDQYYRIEFNNPLPFEVKETAILQVSSLLLFLNQMIELPGFELDELNNRVSFRYVLLAKEQGIDSKLFLSIIGIIMMSLELFADTIYHLAEAKVSFNELLEQVIKMGKEISPKNIKPKELL